MRKTLYLCALFVQVLLYFSFSTQAQSFGGNPPSLKFQQIDNDTVRVIFPVGMEEAGKSVATNVLQLSRLAPQTLGDQVNKVNIVLQNQTVVSNGYVGTAPFKSEFFLSPPASSNLIGSMNWLELLTIHEHRHVMQFNNARRGISKWAYLLAGQPAWGGAAFLSIPNWFFEGDAVVAETHYSEQGRGRLPSFFNGYRRLVLDDRLYRYDKARNGSLKDVVPDHYPLGYLICTYGREKYGEQFWTGILHESAAYDGIFYPFSRAIKRRTGENSRRFYESSMAHYHQKWDAAPVEQAELSKLFAEEQPNEVISYSYPQSDGKGGLFYYKEGFKQVGKIYHRNQEGQEKELLIPGIVVDPYYAANSESIYYAGLNFHERWGWKNYSDIYRYDLQNGKTKRLSKRQKYFSPAPSPDNKALAVVENTAEQVYSLCLISAEDGSLIKKLPNPDRFYYTYPQWHPEGTGFIYTAARSVDGQMSILQIDTLSGRYTALIPWSFHVIGVPEVGKDYIYFSASFSGYDQIYRLAYRSDEKALEQLTFGEKSRYQAALLADGRLVTSEYGLQGNKLKTVELTKARSIGSDLTPPRALENFQYQLDDQSLSIQSSAIADTFQIKPYRLLSKPINVYSWQPSISYRTYGIRLESENMLNTLRMSAGYTYNTNENAGSYALGVSYAQYFPIVSLGFTQRERSVTLGNLEDVDWIESSIQAGVQLPFNFSNKQFGRSLSFRTSLESIQSNDNPEGISVPSVIAANNRLTFLMRRVKARQHIFSHLGIYTDIRYAEALDNNDSRQLLIQSEFALPGLWANHNFILEASYHNEAVTGGYRFSNLFNFSRGFVDLSIYDEAYKFSGNYHFPILYPDRGAAGLLYLLRCRGNIFLDYGRIMYDDFNLSGQSRNFNNHSTGMELIFDTRILNSFGASIGIRYSRRLDGDFSKMVD